MHGAEAAQGRLWIEIAARHDRLLNGTGSCIMAYLRRSVLGILVFMLASMPLCAAERTQIVEFMQVTGFDVSLESLRVSARDAPTMLGLDADDFGLSWTRLADRLFEPEALKRDALEILQQALQDDVLEHAAAFYGSELGQRLVVAENESHFLDSATGARKESFGRGLMRACITPAAVFSRYG